jgi:hypothetical protein
MSSSPRNSRGTLPPATHAAHLMQPGRAIYPSCRELIAEVDARSDPPGRLRHSYRSSTLTSPQATHPARSHTPSPLSDSLRSHTLAGHQAFSHADLDYYGPSLNGQIIPMAGRPSGVYARFDPVRLVRVDSMDARVPAVPTLNPINPPHSPDHASFTTQSQREIGEMFRPLGSPLPGIRRHNGDKGRHSIWSSPYPTEGGRNARKHRWIPPPPPPRDTSDLYELRSPSDRHIYPNRRAAQQQARIDAPPVFPDVVRQTQENVAARRRERKKRKRKSVENQTKDKNPH